MPKRRLNFTIFKRKIKLFNDKVVSIYYYYTYNELGERLRFSTGKELKTDAINYVNELFKKVKLIPDIKKSPTLESYSKEFWIYDGKRGYKLHYLEKE